ncbi:hypothetical protein [Methanoculleus chikugoensis]|uniref:Uncharacterized protein n=1 Tax=Methanoculleus chikugoensis TaxID=118126 RepID=A0ABM7H3N6_9EURY|nr:hypothetical protein [Methanoculleus chikugoensis]BBL67389.1 hypothetical protein MchiMG62_05700 [Methanoculleus chikugoensis]
MYSRIRKSDSNESIIKSMGPYRFHSSGNSIASVQSSGSFGPIGTITIVSPLQYPIPEAREKAPKPSKQEDFRMLMKKNKKTLELLAK